MSTSDPKPFRGWAVFDRTGRVAYRSLADAERRAWQRFEREHQIPKADAEAMGYTVRRVVVTVTADAPNKQTKGTDHAR